MADRARDLVFLRPPTSIALSLFIYVSTFFIASFLSAQAAGQCNTGAAFFAGMSPRFPRAAALSVFDGARSPATSVLWGSFGSDPRFVRRFVRAHPAGEVMIYLTNEVGRRNRRPGKGDLLPGYGVRRLNSAVRRRDPVVLRAYRRRVSRILKFTENEGGPLTKWVMVLGLEDNYRHEVADTLLALAREKWPYPVARNPNGNRFPASDSFDYREFHGLGVFPDEPRTITTIDGVSWDPRRPEDVRRIKDFLGRHKHTHRNLLWHCSTQDICGRFIDTQRRRPWFVEALVRVMNQFQRNPNI